MNSIFSEIGIKSKEIERKEKRQTSNLTDLSLPVAGAGNKPINKGNQ